MSGRKMLQFSGRDGVVMRFQVLGEPQVQAGAVLPLATWPNATFARWSDEAELSVPPAEWLLLQMPEWVKARARVECGEDFASHILPDTRTVLLLNPDPVYTAQDGIDRYPEKSRARRYHREHCWSMRNEASKPVDMRDVAAGRSRIFGLALRLLDA